MGERIGEGSFGVVYGCVDGWKNDLAAKVLKQRAPYQQTREAAEAEFREADASSSPTRHIHL
jgi:hypothetical protein